MSKPTGIKVVGGGNNIFDNINISMESSNSEGILVQDTINNKFSNIEVVIQEKIRNIEKFQSKIEDISDNSINLDTGNSFQYDIIKSLEEIKHDYINNNNDKRSISSLMSNISSWITVKGEIMPILAPYFYLILDN